MPDAVDCAECGHRYDSDDVPFCPRCGSDRGGSVAGAVGISERERPARRRVQMGGVVLLVLSLLWGMMAVWPAVAPQHALDVFADVQEDQPGGEVRVTVQENGTPLEGREVRLEARNGTVLDAGTTDGNGTAVLRSETGLAFVVVEDEEPWRRMVLWPDPERVEVDVGQDDREDPLGLDGGLVQAVRLLSLSVIGIALVIGGGGLAAVRLRRREWAMAAAVMALGLAAVALFLFQLWGAFVAVPLVLGGAFILSGRRLLGR